MREARPMHWSSSGGIIDTLNGLLEKGETQLNTATATVTTNKNNFDQLKQSLTDEIKFANKDMDDAKKGLAESAEIKAAAEGDLDVTTKALNEDLHALGNLHMDCMTNPRLRTSRPRLPAVVRSLRLWLWQRRQWWRTLLVQVVRHSLSCRSAPASKMELSVSTSRSATPSLASVMRSALLSKTC